MQTVTTVKEVREILDPIHKKGQTVGLVPTMGYLHDGHLSLIQKAREENDFVVVSIFVNPTQFSPNEDLDQYPRDFERDQVLCEAHGVDLIFHPDASEMYHNHKTYVSVDDLSQKLCGKTRPIHFRGVATVCTKLFHITKADRAYFGQKDAQQFFILNKMVRDLNFDIALRLCPIVRAESGLALSSRNKYLSDAEKEDALVLSRALKEARALLDAGERQSAVILDAMKKVIATAPDAKIDYVKIVDVENLDDVEVIDRDVLVALAVYVGPARLIDNLIFKFQ
ncbi:MAG: pantoate--beta-alanine ligase [Peptoniphilaceae bacterium]|nr:pantoate--beta-alanine ligase [Peptoniphilaceae bacterium]MDY6085781.1 pantoate--beta-alanine ligase [Peptoniphilaceae bacterium]